MPELVFCSHSSCPVLGVGAADKDQVAPRGQHGGEELPREVMLPHLLAGGGIPRLQLAVVIRAWAHGQPDILGICAEPELSGYKRLLDPGEAAAEPLLSRDVNQVRLRTVSRGRPVL